MQGPQNNPYNISFVTSNYIIDRMKIGGTFNGEEFQILKSDRKGRITMTAEETITASELRKYTETNWNPPIQTG